MPKRNKNTVSYKEAVTDVLQWLENEGETEDNDNVDMIFMEMKMIYLVVTNQMKI